MINIEYSLIHSLHIPVIFLHSEGIVFKIVCVCFKITHLMTYKRCFFFNFQTQYFSDKIFANAALNFLNIAIYCYRLKFRNFRKRGGGSLGTWGCFDTSSHILYVFVARVGNKIHIVHIAC